MKPLALCSFIIYFSLFASAQQDTSTNLLPSTFGISFTMENAFGFYPVIYGSMGLSETLDFTYYGAMWTNPAFGFPQSTFSSDLWLENSFGLGFKLPEQHTYINPALGFTHGKFLSGGDQSVAFEGIVPSLALYISPGNWESEMFFSLYQHLRNEVSDPISRSTADFIFYWITPGYRVSDRISVGVHFEGLFLRFGESAYDSSYQWLGPYIKFTSKGKYNFRFMAGPNLKKGIYADEFYKLSTNIPLE